MSDEGALFVIGFLLGGLISLGLVGSLVLGSAKTDAVKHGAAHYDTVTGEWRWNDAPKAEAK